jgi:hypothetical protein
MDQLFSTAEKMQSDLTGVMGEVDRYINIANNVTKVDPNKLDHNRVNVPQGVFDRVTALHI